MEKKNYDVLLVNDEPDILNFVEKILEVKLEGITCKLMLDGGDILKELEDYHPKVVVLDEITPSTNGYVLCKQIKTTPKLSHIPVFIFGHEELINRNLDCKADGYFPYPFDHSDLDVIVDLVKPKSEVKKNE